MVREHLREWGRKIWGPEVTDTEESDLSDLSDFKKLNAVMRNPKNTVILYGRKLQFLRGYNIWRPMEAQNLWNSEGGGPREGFKEAGQF